MQVTAKQLYVFLANGGYPTPQDADGLLTFAEFVEGWVGDGDEMPFDQTTYDALQKCDLKNICAAWEMSENHLGGDDMVSLAAETAAAMREGYEIFTWYGPESEALVVGYRPSQLTVVE